MQGSGRLPLLDGLRTVAAVGVMLYHAPEALGREPFSRMYLFVDIFFILSGFVLTLSAEPRFVSGLTAMGFVKARIVRLWPMVALGALLGTAAFLIEVPFTQVGHLLILSLVMLPLVTSQVAVFPVNAPQWSIFWEIVANFLHAALLRRLGDHALLWIAAASGAAMIAAIFHVGWAGFGPNGEHWWLAFLRIAWAYTLGVWMARRWKRQRFAPVAGWKTALVLPFAVLAILPQLPLTIAQGDALFVIVALPVLFWIAVAAVPAARAEPMLGRVGALSYPIYAVHLPVILAFHFATGGRDYEWLAVVTALAAAALIAWLGPAARRTCRSALGPRARANAATA